MKTARRHTVDFSEQLERQLRFLETSAAAFDIGNHDEAIRIATCLRIIFHQSSKSTSLLSHLGAEKIQILSTNRQTPVGPGTGLNIVNNLMLDPFAATLRAAPWLEKAPRKDLIPCTEWWQGEVVLFNDIHLQIKRWKLVCWAANQDGGTHVAVPHGSYEKLRRGLDCTFTLTDPEGRKRNMSIEKLHLAALRQLAYEVLNSPDVLRLAGRPDDAPG